MKTVRFVLLSLLLVPIITLFSMTGCATDGTDGGIVPIQPVAQGELSQQQIEQIFYDSMANQTNLNFYKFNMDMDMITDVIGAESGKMTVLTTSNGAANLASNQLQMQMEMDMSMEGLGDEGGSQSIAYDIYQMADWVYMRMEISGMGEQWIKTPTSEETYEQLDLVNQQLGPLESAVDIEFMGYANVDGEECYVLSLVPDMNNLTDWLNQQQGAGTQDINWGNISDLSDVFKKLEYTYYITRDTKLPKRLIVDMQMELTSEQTGLSGGDYDKMTMDISVDMTLYDYNEPFSIDLPDEAENAMEAPESMYQ